MDDDNTVNLFFGSTRGVSEASKLASQLRFDTDVSMSENDDQDAMSVSQADEQSEGEAVIQEEEDSLPSLDSSEHERFAQAAKSLNSNNIETYFASVKAHLVVLSTVERYEGEDALSKYYRSEHDTWALLEFLRCVRNNQSAVPSSPHLLTDREILDSQLSSSPTAQLLHALVRWCHLTSIDRAPSMDAVRSKDVHERLKRIRDVFDDEKIGQALWKFIRAGAFYFVGEQAKASPDETKESLSRVRMLLEPHPHLVWRLVSMLGGQPFHVEGPGRSGNAHRATWKLACRAIARDKSASILERKIYCILGGIVEENELNLERDTRLWWTLRGLSERWSDEILYHHHAACSQRTRGRRSGEADGESEKELVPSPILGSSQELMNAIVRAFEKEATTPEEVDSSDIVIFSRVRMGIIKEESVDSIIQRELELLREEASTAKKGSKLRFLCHFALYADASPDQSSSLLSIQKPSLKVKREIVKLYLEFLSTASSQVLAFVPSVLFALEDRESWMKLTLQRAAMTWTDLERTKLLNQFSTLTNDLSKVVLEVISSSSNTDKLDHFPGEAMFHAECEKRKTNQVDGLSSHSDLWNQLWYQVELFRWTLLMNDPWLTIRAGNILVRRSAEMYLVGQDAQTRALAWKMGEVVLSMIKESLTVTENEIQCWDGYYQAWKCVASLDVQMETIQTLMSKYERHLEILGERNPVERHAIMNERDSDIDAWTDENVEDNENGNLNVLAGQLSEAFARALSLRFLNEDDTVRSIRDRFVGKLIQETFRSLGAAATYASTVRSVAQKAGLTRMHAEVIRLSEVVNVEVIRRMASLPNQAHGDSELKEQVRSMLKVVANAAKSLLEFNERPLTLAFTS